MADESLTKQICPVTQNILVMRQLLLSLGKCDTHDFVDWRKKLNTSVKNRVYKMSYFTGINNLQSATHDLMRVSKQV